MSNWRVIQQRDQDGMPYFMIADVADDAGQPGRALFIRHEPPYPIGRIDDLRIVLQAMLAALDKPPLIMLPARLEEKTATPPQSP